MNTKHNLSNTKMGIRAGLTKHFSISEKLLLNSPHKVTLSNGDSFSLTIEKWIEYNPLYVLDSLKSGRIQLTIDAHTRLFEVLKMVYPEQYNAYYKKKSTVSAYKKAQVHKRNEEQKWLGK